MNYYHASIEQLQKILEVDSLDRTPELMITLDDSDEKVLLADLDKINKLISNTTRFITDLAFMNKSGQPIKGDDLALRQSFVNITQTLQKKYILQVQVREKVKSEPFGPYFDFFRTPKEPHNQFGKKHPQSEVDGLIRVQQVPDKKVTQVFVDCESNTIATRTAPTLK